MSHTTSSYHDVAGITVSAPQLDANKQFRWQTVRFAFSDGSTHDITAFLASGARPLPLMDKKPTTAPLGPPFSEPFGSARPATELAREPRTIRETFGGEAITGAWADETLLGHGSLFDKAFGQGDLSDG